MQQGCGWFFFYKECDSLVWKAVNHSATFLRALVPCKAAVKTFMSTPTGSGSKPVFEDLIVPSGRRNRKSYLLFVLAEIALILTSLGCFVLVGAIASVFNNRFLEDVAVAFQVVLAVIVGLLIVATLVSGLFVCAQRLRDFGWPGAAVLFCIIPGVGVILSLVLMVIPGTLGPNRYGEDPTQS